VHGVDETLDGRADPLGSRGFATLRLPRGACGVEQVEQVRAFGVVELERVRDAVDDALGGTWGVTALQSDVVLRRNARENRNFLTAQARDASPVAAVDGQTCLLRRDPGATGREELADLRPHLLSGVSGLVAGSHDTQPTSGAGPVGVTVSGLLDRAFHVLLRAGYVDLSTAGRAALPTIV
jgi:hypothetical protein